MHWLINSRVPYPMLTQEKTIRKLRENGVGPEIYFSSAVLDGLTPREAEQTAEALRNADFFSLTFHAPFHDLWLGARDEEARRLAVRRVKQVISFAPLFRPAGIVVHGGYCKWLFDFRPDEWLEPAKRSFGELAEEAEKTDTRLFVENVFDDEPSHLLRLRDGVGSPRLGFCFDPGHAALFSDIPLHQWAQALGENILEMHAHDNRSQRDDHLPVGEGTLNYRGTLLAVLDAGAHPIMTVEPHRKEHFSRSLSGLREILSSIT